MIKSKDKNCIIAECKKNINGICTSKKRCSKYYRCGEEVGIYKNTLDNNVYIGMSNSGINSRVNTEKSRLRKDNPQSVNKEMQKCFNQLCLEEPELTKEELLEKYFSKDILESSTRWIKVDENYNDIDFSSQEEKIEAIFKAKYSTNPEVQMWNRMADEFWKRREHIWIKKYKELDIQNGTNNCLNVKD